jgi:tetratricopeptide (TPR) repeat protein
VLIGLLLDRYWRPVYCYLRHKEYDNEDAKDLTQAFFHEVVLNRNLIQRADQSKGRFRTFLLHALDQYLLNEKRRQTTQKRSPKGKLVSFDIVSPPALPEAVSRLNPEDSYNYAWTASMLDQVLSEVEAKCLEDDLEVYKDAESLFVTTLNEQREKFGQRGETDTFSMMMIRCMNELALLYVIQNSYDEAEALFAEGIEIGDSQLPGKNHPFMLRHVNGLGVLRTKQKRYEEAEALFERALSGRKVKLGEDHPYTLETINGLGLLRAAQKRYNEAEEFLNKALDGRLMKLGPEHPYTLESIYELAALYKKQGDYEKAEPLFVKVVEGRRFKLGDTHPNTQESLNNLIDLYEAWGKTEKAAGWRAKLPQAEALVP